MERFWPHAAVLRIILLLYAVPQNAQADVANSTCNITNVPGIPNITFANVNTTAVHLSWLHPDDLPTYYKYEIQTTNMSGATIVEQTLDNSTMAVVTGLQPGTRYHFNVTLVEADCDYTVEQFGYTMPKAVTNLTAADVNTSAVSLTWLRQDDHKTGYSYQVTVLENVTQVQQLNTTTENYTVTSLTPGVNYTFQVSTVVQGVKSTEESTSSYTVPGAVTNLTFANVNTTAVRLSWFNPEDQQPYYEYKIHTTDILVATIVETTQSNSTTAIVTGLQPGTGYCFNVTVVVPGRESAVEHELGYTLPKAVTNLTAADVNTSAVSLTWLRQDDHKTGYSYQVTVLENVTQVQQLNTTTENYTVTSLTPGVNYTFQVSTVVQGVKSTEETTSSYTVPKAVTNLTAADVNTSAVSLTWLRQDDHKTGYSYQVTVLENVTQVQQLNTTTENYTVTSLTPGVNYTFQVSTVVQGVKSTEESTSSYTVPKAVTDLKVADVNTTAVSLTWLRQDDHKTGYSYQVTVLENVTQVQQLNTTTENYTVTSLTPGVNYTFQVSTVVQGVKSTEESTSSYTVPKAVTDLKVADVNTTAVSLTWLRQDDHKTGYSYQVTVLENVTQIQQLNTTTENYTVISLTPGVNYIFRVSTVVQGVKSTEETTSSYTVPGAVTDLTVVNVNTTAVNLIWQNPDDQQPYYEYKIQTTNYKMSGTTIVEQFNINMLIVTGLQPGTGYCFNVTVGVPGRESAVEHKLGYTMPKAVTDLTAADVNTTAVRLTWLRQDDHKPDYSYQVTVLEKDNKIQQLNTTTESYTVTGLTPGVNYTSQVATVVQGVKSTEESVTFYTNPGTVSNIVALGTTTNMSVTWKAASGQVDYYSVELTGAGQMDKGKSRLSNTTLYVLFEKLNPGTLYHISVCAISGPGSECLATDNATFPNPPGPLTVESQTTHSINVSWSSPTDEKPGQYNFSVSYLNRTKSTENSWFLLEDLESGTLYNITVVTVGPLGLQSEMVSTSNSTRPYPVSDLRQTGIAPSSLVLTWSQQGLQSGYSYLVHVSNSTTDTAFESPHNFSGLVSGGNYTCTVTTQTGDGTQTLYPGTTPCHTQPHAVGAINATTQNTTAIGLSWEKPRQYRDANKYRIEASGCASRNVTVVNEQAEMAELSPGTQCQFCVLTISEAGFEGEARCTHQYTKPEQVHPTVSNRVLNQGLNDTILVSWAAPAGNVEHYYVYLNSSDQTESRRLSPPEPLSHLFDNLCPGREYSAMVITSSGPFNTTSRVITNATFPNPPEKIEFLTKSTSSIVIRWQHAQFKADSWLYVVTYVQSNQAKSNFTNSPNYTFSHLNSGTPYNFSVATEGPLRLQSCSISISNTTKPEKVQSLNISTEEEATQLTWARPDGYKASYSYLVTWSGEPMEPMENATQQENLNVYPLVPGSPYNYSVTTVTSDGTRSDSVDHSKCTKASSVQNLTCSSPNEKIAQILLVWSRPKGRSSDFGIGHRQNDNKPITIITVPGSCSPDCEYTISNLTHYTKYQVTMQTLSCGSPSELESRSCTTGITDPFIPSNYKSLVQATVNAHDRFTVNIQPQMLDATNGPIRYYGVLLTDSLNDMDSSELKQFLNQTYANWSAGKTTTYLARVRKVESGDRSRFKREVSPNLPVEIGTGETWRGYTNGALRANHKYRYAIVLFTRLNESTGSNFVDSKYSLVTITPFYPVIQTLLDPVVIGTAVGASLGVFCVLFIIIIGFIIYWKKMNRKECSDIQINSISRQKVNISVHVVDYEAYYRKQKADSNCGFAEEFDDLKPVGTAQSRNSALALENKTKNRYNNVLPYDSSRVKLSIQGTQFDDYINASYMPGYNSKKEYIGAQGPLPGTVNEFWRMVWEKNIQTLVMLTRCNEQGRVKCEKYWPEDSKHFGNNTVTMTSEITLEDWTIREFDIKNVKTAETRSVRHFHFTAWPDHGVPESTELLINFRHLVREHMDQYSANSPTVVHCSAGVGRTGTFIAIDRLIFQIERESMVDVYGTIHDLRMHRTLMVQTEDQYVFLNQCALDIIRSRTGTNVDLIYQNTDAMCLYENIEPRKILPNKYHNA
ncbi:receptor-type tyrosine-protein phosphatase eta isoform X3 [Gadus macrocephalus]|uniref:receptor-type tyrosine-protein phosphatase eta isoform X3 n=1 Tax=Gadus macrocephalus TaxID=80720 RepID=UPI0028CB9F68|nr:receptor-type tyrosine-protein phosphatase eta isoform X3 [Gadus macrocephalus]